MFVPVVITIALLFGATTIVCEVAVLVARTFETATIGDSPIMVEKDNELRSFFLNYYLKLSRAALVSV